MPDPQFSDPKKLRAAVHQRLVAEFKKMGASLKQLTPGSLRVFFTGAIILPLAAAGLDPQAIAQTLAGILGGLSTEHFFGVDQKFLLCRAEKG
jgi:hypothetical protein